jgi:hypothetical protein
MTGRLICAAMVLLTALVAGCILPPASQQRSPSEQTAERSAIEGSRPTGDLLSVRVLDERKDLVLVEADSGRELARHPWGVSTPDWNLLYRAEFAGATTALRVIDLKTGAARLERTLSGGRHYELPIIANLAGEPGGLSPKARWLVLQARGAEYETKSAFAILDGKLDQATTFVELDGSFHFDAISDSGRYLYLEERLGAGPSDGYRVRVYDLKAGTLLPGILVDKTVQADRMVGGRAATLVSPDGGWQYTLYVREGGKPFIHAIKLEERWSLCLFFPVETSGEADLAWSFVASPDGRLGYVVNSLKGYVAAVDLAGARVLRSGSFQVAQLQPSLLESLARFFVPIAEAKSEMFSSAVVTPDGRTLYAVGEFGTRLYTIATDSLSVRARHEIDGRIMGLGLSPDGARLYAIDGETGRLLRIDPESGTVLSRAGLGGAPGLILRIETKGP